MEASLNRIRKDHLILRDFEQQKSLGIICTLEDCTRETESRGLCNACKLRIYRNSETGKRRYKNQWLQKVYGITIEDFEAMLENQNYCCAICDKEINLYGNKTNVDHCHRTGIVRGLLCSSCNSLLALAKESEEILVSAINYLRR